MDKKLFLGVATALLFIAFVYVIYLQRSQIKALSTKNTELTEQLKSINSYYKKQFEDIQNINSNLQNKLDSLNSNDCGKEQVPQYLIDAQRDLLRGI